jgi:hypothetical protein
MQPEALRTAAVLAAVGAATVLTMAKFTTVEGIVGAAGTIVLVAVVIVVVYGWPFRGRAIRQR